MLARWRTPHTLLLGGVSLLASCAALGLAASNGRIAEARSALAALPSEQTRASLTPGALGQKSVASALTGSKAAPHASAVAASGSAAPAATAGAPARARCPEDMLPIEGSCVDRYEAHLLARQADGSFAVHPAYERPDASSYVAASSAGVAPQAFISQVEASAACENAGKRLCGLTEWYRACTGSEHTTYPYGAHYEAGRCNVGKPHLLSMLHGASAAGWSYADFNDPELGRRPGFLALTGEYAGCTSPEGVHDMVGNLHEWVADRVDASLPRKLPVAAVIQRRIGRHVGNGIFMGGFFSTTNQHGDGCQFTTAAHDPRYHDYSTGFRCCQDPTDAAPNGQSAQSEANH